MRELLGDDPEGRLTLGYALAQAEELPPPVWVVQGDQDFVVRRRPMCWWRGRAGRPGWVVKYSVRNGGHGFDAVHTVEEDWLREGVEFFKGYWLGDN
jgi:surfactin synthase thioesterase subunit